MTIFTSAQQKSIKDLGFLIGNWNVREDNKETNWYEESYREGRYILDSTYIELKTTTFSPNKKRTYIWYVHLNSKTQLFEMVSIYSNWHKVQFDIIHWDFYNRKLTVKNGIDPSSREYYERFGEIIFDEDFNSYIWNGKNKYGNPKKPNVWNYIEKGTRIE